LQIGKTAQAKHARTDNLLPLDAGIGVEKLSALFLRPNTILKSSIVDAGGASISTGKTVGFDMTAVETWGGAANDSFGGDDNDGDGFCFGGDDSVDGGDDDGIFQLEDVRKVEKVRVGHATVAKKVDVKRLKRDLWVELETCFAARVDEADVVDNASMEKEESKTETPDKQTAPAAAQCLSFHDAVLDLETAKSQADVTLPFYFICVLHLANEKGLRLDSKGLRDFDIYQDDDATLQMF
jgi:condensin complex subunit 2